ncbi:MAG: heavy metal-responsive transcriptional regulator [Pyrinomonadaceae bacterium]
MVTARHTKPLSGGAGRGLKIGDVSKETGVGVEALRFYERRGLLGRPARTEGGYRLYDESVVEQISFIKRAQAVGFSLDEIAGIIAERAGGRTPCREVREMARRKLTELDERLKELRRHRRELARTLRDWDGRGEDEGHVCGLIEKSTIRAPDSGGGGWQRARRVKRK